MNLNEKRSEKNYGSKSGDFAQREMLVLLNLIFLRKIFAHKTATFQILTVDIKPLIKASSFF